MKSEQIIQEIRTAFADVPRPHRTMADAEVLDDQDEASRFQEHDARWWDIPDAILCRCSAPFCFLENESLAYYLPAYMNWTIRTNGEASGVSTEWLIYFMEDHNRGGRLCSCMSAAQRSAACSFLRWVLDTRGMAWIHDHARKALALWEAGGSAEPAVPAYSSPASRQLRTHLARRGSESAEP